MRNTWRIEPQAHRLDREAMLAEHRVVAARVQRDVDDAVAAAAVKRHAFLDWFVARMIIDAGDELERERHWADLRLSSGAGADTARKPAASTEHLTGADVEVEAARLAGVATG